MNAHIPQSYEAMVELEDIAAVPHHIITPRHAKPMIGIYQDTLVGSYLLTQTGINFNRREFMNLMMWNKRFDGTMPIARMRDGPERWTGQQVLGALLPPINMEFGNKLYKPEQGKESTNYLKITEGVIEQGVVDVDVYMKPSKGIVHVTYNDHGPKETVDLLDSLQNTVENFLVLNGFSVGISDLIADEETKQNIDKMIQERKKLVEQVILQVHLDLFDNNTGKTNQQEFEDQIFGILNQATTDAGSAGQQSLSSENRLLAMVRSGSKGEPLNVAQMMACLGQTAIEGKRVPYGFTDRTLPHYKKYDDSSEARGFIESSFIRGLTPQQFFFHAMSGREGLIDTAVKSVTADTEIIIMENGQTKWTTIGSWIDGHIDGADPSLVEHHKEANMELLKLKHEVFIPTCDDNGVVTWGQLTAVTRHDPGECLYEIKTQAGKQVIVTAGKSLLIWNENSKTLKEVFTKDAKVGDKVPITMNLPDAPVTHNTVDMSMYFPKTEYVHGTDFHIAKLEMDKAMNGNFHIPSGWWNKHNKFTFTLPYPNKARFQRVNSGRSTISHIKKGYIYPYHAKRNDVLIPEHFELNEKNGIFIGLFLADGNVDIPSGYIQITKNNDTIRRFVEDWFDDMGIKHHENIKEIQLNTINGKESHGVTSDIRGYSRLFGQFLTAFVGHGSENKHVPDIAFTAPIEFVKGLLNGYISGDGSVSNSSINVSSVSPRLIDGISMLCSRIGIFTYKNIVQGKPNNIGTPTILKLYMMHIRSKWAGVFKNNMNLIHPEKQQKLNKMTYSEKHVNYVSHNDIVLDTITEINEISPMLHPKMYDVSVPSTLNFAIANGLHGHDTADTGYIQRQLIKSMEDLTVQHDGTVRDANNNIIQFHYGEDGINPTKIETQSLSIGELSHEEIENSFRMKEVDWSTVLVDGTVRDNDEEMLTEYVSELLFDQRMMVEGVFQKKSLDNGSVFAPVNLQRWILNTKVRCGLKPDSKTNLTPSIVLNGIKKIIERTHPYHKIWCALLRFHLAPHKIIVKERFTKEAFEMLMEIILVSHMKAWVQPGEQVGIVAAQSIGEPATQMSTIGHSLIVLQNDKNLKYYGSIGEICDSILEQNKEKVITIGKDSVVLPLEENYYIVGVSENEKTSWKRISEISRHPANGGLVEVVTRTGRKTTATLTHSFLKRSTEGIVPVLGSELQVGMRIPIARVIPETPNPSMEFIQGKTTFTLNREFGWVCGMYLADGRLNYNNVSISKINPIVEEKLKLFANKYGMRFTAKKHDGQYGPGKDNDILSKDLKDFLLATFKTGSYEKEIGATVFHANKEFIAGVICGYFDGDGNVNVPRQQIRASSRSKKLIEQITALLGYVGLFGSMSCESSIRIKDKVQHTLTILPKFAKMYKEQVGFNMPEKAQALDEIIEYNSREDAHAKPEAIDKITELGAVIAETGKLLKMPGQSRIYGRWLKKEAIGRQTLEKYVGEFEAKINELEKYYEKVKTNMEILKSALNADVVWDEIVELIYHEDPKEYVYDFTVPGNDSFMVDCNVLVHNTLNSVDWDTEIIIAKNGKMITPKIGEFIDKYYYDCLEDKEKQSKIQNLPNGQIYIPLEDGNDWKAISCDEDGIMKWTKLEAITRHPVINEDGTNTILKVIMESGREVKATKGKSFLTLQNGKILEANGSDLKVGDSLPIANHLKIDHLDAIKEISLRSIPTEYLYGSDVSQIPESIELTQQFGFFCGAYLAEGMSNDTQIMISNNDKEYLNKVSDLMDSWNVGTHMNQKEIKKSGIKGLSTTLVIHSTILAKGIKTWFGRVSYEKNIPNWVIQAPDEFLKGLMDGYISGDGTVDKRQGTVHATSVSKKLLEGIQLILARYNIYSTMTNRMPNIGKFDSVVRNYTLTIPKKYSTIFASTFTLTITYKQYRLNSHHLHRISQRISHHISHSTHNISKWKTTNDVVWDKIKSIEEVQPMGEGWVYDITVEETRNFVTNTLICQKDTFHQAGVASKSAVTRGVPRLRELLKVTQNPKASSLTIYMKPEYRNDKEKARELIQDLELTVLRNITDRVSIYWDQKDDETVVEEDRRLMEFYRMFEERQQEEQWSKWMLRLELNREEMFNRNISIQDVVFVIKQQSVVPINVVYSDYNSDNLIMRIRLPDDKHKDRDTSSNIDDFTNLKKFQNKLLNSIVIRGLSGIKAVTFRKDKKYVEMVNGKYEIAEQFVLDTDGSNFINVLNHPLVDGTRLYSTNVWDVYEVLGIEATRAVLFNEINELFDSVGVNYRHLCLLCDVMTRCGRLMSIDRYGINKNDIGPLAKASFEETEKILLKAGWFGEVDPVIGVSANIMMGQSIRGGTAFSQILLDDHVLGELLTSVDVDKHVLEEEKEGDLSRLDDLIISDPCSITKFQMNMVLPSAKTSMEEPDVEIDII